MALRLSLPAVIRAVAGAVAGLLAAFSAEAQQDGRPIGRDSPDTALARLLQEARAGCARPGADRLTKILCSGHMRIGVREFYPLFGTREGEVRLGYEPDIARAIAAKLGVAIDFSRVNAASRIPLLAEDRIDLTIATMGHNTQRDSQARFILPHYYRSETTVVGPRILPVANMTDLPGRTVCVTIGNLSNAELVAGGARLMLFDEAGLLPDRLKDDTCTLAAQDDSFFAYYFTDPAFSERFFQKFGFAQVPWGMAVARQGSAELGRALDLISQIFHRDGVFLELGRKNRIGTGFLREQQLVWQRPECNTATGSANPGCVLPALNTTLQPTSFAKPVASFEDWFELRTGIDLTLPMLKTAPAWSMFKEGVVNSLILIAGALAATLALAVVFGAAMGSRSAVLRWPARAVTVTLQSSPIVLTLVIAAAIGQALVPFSDAVAIGASILALGLSNGANAGQAISEAVVSLRAEPGAAARAGFERFVAALGRSATQLVAFLVNAAKGTPIASFIGAPELLSTLTDITSFSSGRATTYTLLLVFYTVVVMIVVWLCGKFQLFLEHRQAAA